jgi:GNAT superfamily N-acetyltransferase
MQEQYLVGMQALEAATTLLQRIRTSHPTAGLLEAADLQWWWRKPRPSDKLPQLFWFDQHGQPSAALVITDWGDSIALDPIMLPDATADWQRHVIERGLAHARSLNLDPVDLVLDRSDQTICQLASSLGFVSVETSSLSVVSAWLAAADRPTISPLPEAYRLLSRRDTIGQPHHMIGRSGPELEQRLKQTSLYRPELDLFVLDHRDTVAAYGLFWFDPISATGLVEPMRTEDDHQRRGLARHLLTSGIELLAQAGAERIKICFSLENPVAQGLYLSVGFRPDRQSIAFSRPIS